MRGVLFVDERRAFFVLYRKGNILLSIYRRIRGKDGLPCSFLTAMVSLRPRPFQYLLSPLTSGIKVCFVKFRYAARSFKER